MMHIPRCGQSFSSTLRFSLRADTDFSSLLAFKHSMNSRFYCFSSNVSGFTQSCERPDILLYICK